MEREGKIGEVQSWSWGRGPTEWPVLKASPLLGEIAFLGGMTVVYKSSIDLFLYVVGSSHENEVNSGGGVTW